jgi:hypothetical protein
VQLDYVPALRLAAFCKGRAWTGTRALPRAHVAKLCRPLCAAVAAAGCSAFTLDGVPRMRERPIQDLVDGLRQLGVDASCTLGTGCPPVAVDARGLPTGTVWRLSVSSTVATATPLFSDAARQMQPVSSSHGLYMAAGIAAHRCQEQPTCRSGWRPISIESIILGLTTCTRSQISMSRSDVVRR